MVHEAVFDSVSFPDGQMIGLACGHISRTEIAFTHEKITVSIEAKTGEVDFYDPDGKKRLSARVEIPSSGDEKFSEVQCVAAGGQIKLGFPQYTYTDNYPHCDGEHDRWTKTLSGFDYLCYDLKNNCVAE